jgi:hypothetical protein
MGTYRMLCATTLTSGDGMIVHAIEWAHCALDAGQPCQLEARGRRPYSADPMNWLAGRAIARAGGGAMPAARHGRRIGGGYSEHDPSLHAEYLLWRGWQQESGDGRARTVQRLTLAYEHRSSSSTVGTRGRGGTRSCRSLPPPQPFHAGARLPRVTCGSRLRRDRATVNRQRASENPRIDLDGASYSESLTALGDRDTRHATRWRASS